MCLSINANNEECLSKFVEGNTSILGYKVLVIKNKKKKDYVSRTMRNFKWNLVVGREFVSDRKNKEVTERERFTRMVKSGFHFYTSAEEAEIVRNYTGQSLIIACFEIKTEDMVAVGDYSYDTGTYKAFVATKCKFVGTSAHRGFNGISV